MNQASAKESAAQGDAKKEGKGKEKETTASAQSTHNGDPISEGVASNPQPFMYRLKSSTAQLAKGLATSHGTSVDMAEALPSSKAGASTATISKDSSTPADVSIRQGGITPSASGSSFRSSQDRGQGASSEAGFSAFLDDTHKLDVEARKHPISSPQPPGFLEPQLQPHERSHVQAAGLVEDGSEVVKFLDSGYDELVGGDCEISLPGEGQAAIRNTLFGDGGQWKRKPAGDYQEDILNLFPDFILNHTNRATDTSNHLGISDPQNARDIWVSHWRDVLSRYTEEVWGDLNPLVQEAREELRTLSDSPPGQSPKPPSETSSLQRLQQILAHLRGF